MGTAHQSISNHIERREFERTLEDAVGDSFDREIQLANVFRKIVNDILFTDPLTAGVRGSLQTKIKNQVTTDITDKLKTWISNGKKPEDWPFKDVALRGEFPPKNP